MSSVNPVFPIPRGPISGGHLKTLIVRPSIPAQPNWV